MATETLTAYEAEQRHAIQLWKDEEPGVVSKAFGVATKPLAWLMRAIIPDSAMLAALSLSNRIAEWTTDTADILRDGGVTRIEDLIGKDLELSDDLANTVHNWAIGIAAVEGTAAGPFGLFAAPVDVPALITLALRTIHKIGICYGYECKTEEDRQFVYAVLSAAGANSVQEKIATLATLQSIKVMLVRETWKRMAEKASQSQLGKEAAVIALKNLARQLGINITKRKALAAIPIIGTAVGGSVNGWYIRDVGWAARRMFQERWLGDTGRIPSQRQ